MMSALSAESLERPKSDWNDGVLIAVPMNDAV